MTNQWDEEIEVSVGYNKNYTIGTVFVNLDGFCASMWFNVAFEAVSLKNVVKLKDECKQILRLREQIILSCC